MDFGRVEQHVYDAHPDVDDANWLPTRWNANRCVDYAISNLPLHCISACLGEEKLSDHRILKLHCEKCLSTAMSSKLRMCDRHPKTGRSVDDAWSSFCKTLEKAFRVAHARARGLRFRPLPKSCRPRNSSPCFIRPTAPVTRHPASFLPCLGIRQARNSFRASRFSEPVTNNERSLCLWRDKLLACDKEVFKWLRGRSGAPTYNLYWNYWNDSPVSMSPLEGTQCLKDFWCSVWNRERPDFANILRVLSDTLNDFRRPTQVGEALTAEDLAKASPALAGTSAGVDGWSGDDLAALPFSVWRQLAPLFYHFETYGLVPSTWVLIRQVHLPKAGKGVRAQDNAVRADALRPVSVLSAWWRLWGRGRLRSRCMSAWISHRWPDDFYGGRQGVSTSDALLPILQSVDEGFYIGSLDFSLAFDSTNPVIPLHVFHQLGMPVGISNMLSSVWCHQARFLQLAGDTDPSPCYVIVLRCRKATRCRCLALLPPCWAHILISRGVFPLRFLPRMWMIALLRVLLVAFVLMLPLRGTTGVTSLISMRTVLICNSSTALSLADVASFEAALRLIGFCVTRNCLGSSSFLLLAALSRMTKIRGSAEPLFLHADARTSLTLGGGSASSRLRLRSLWLNGVGWLRFHLRRRLPLCCHSCYG